MSLINLMPKYYAKSCVMKVVLGSLEAELKVANIKVEKTQDELFVIKADEHLALHEQDVGVELQGSVIATRRGRVLLRLRGTGTATKAHIQNIVSAFVDGAVEVTEYFSEYFFTAKIRLNKEEGYNATNNINYAIDEIKPAHLAHVLYALFSPLRFFTKNTIAFPVFAFHAAVQNYAILLTGWRTLDGTWILGERCMHVKISALGITAAMVNRKFTGSVGFKFSLQTRNNYMLSGALEQSRIYSLDGATGLNGEFKLGRNFINREVL